MSSQGDHVTGTAFGVGEGTVGSGRHRTPQGDLSRAQGIWAGRRGSWAGYRGSGLGTGDRSQPYPRFSPKATAGCLQVTVAMVR